MIENMKEEQIKEIEINENKKKQKLKIILTILYQGGYRGMMIKKYFKSFYYKLFLN